MPDSAHRAVPMKAHAGHDAAALCEGRQRRADSLVRRGFALWLDDCGRNRARALLAFAGRTRAQAESSLRAEFPAAELRAMPRSRGWWMRRWRAFNTTLPGSRRCRQHLLDLRGTVFQFACGRGCGRFLAEKHARTASWRANLAIPRRPAPWPAPAPATAWRCWCPVTGWWAPAAPSPATAGGWTANGKFWPPKRSADRFPEPPKGFLRSIGGEIPLLQGAP